MPDFIPTDQRSGSSDTFIKSHPVLSYFLMTFVISWGGIYLITFNTGIPGQGEALDQLYGFMFLPMLAGPFFSAVILSLYLDGSSGLKALTRRYFIWRAEPIEYAVSFLLIPVCAFAALWVLSFTAPEFTPGFLVLQYSPTTIGLMLAGGFAVGLIEEAGWTGFATPRLLKQYNFLAVSIALGIIHGFWHLMVLYWSEALSRGALLAPFFLTLWIIAIINLRILAIWIFKRTGSLLLAAIVHASHSGWLFVVWPPSTNPSQDITWTAVFGLLGLIAALAVVYLASPTSNER